MKTSVSTFKRRLSITTITDSAPSYIVTALKDAGVVALLIPSNVVQYTSYRGYLRTFM